MGSRFFHVFSEMIDKTPALAVLALTEAERQMRERDLVTGDADASDPATGSILSFCRFLRAAAARGPVSAVLLPIDHLAFYRNTVERLIEAGELPASAKDLFDETYRESFLQMFQRATQEEPRLRILHLEDDPLDGELAELCLQDLGIPFSIKRVDTEDSFEASLRSDVFDVIISDSRLPGFDTLHAVGVARQRFPGIPFIFLSGNSNPRVKAESFERGATDYVEKNDLPRLLEVIRTLEAPKEQAGCPG